MKQPLSRAFAAVLVAVLLLCSAVVAGTIFHRASMLEQISNVQANLEASRGRLRKQQMEYDQVVAELPVVLAKLADIQPQADAAHNKEQALRQQRKELRAENATLADELTSLLAQTSETSTDAALTLEALTLLQNALTELQTIRQLPQ